MGRNYRPRIRSRNQDRSLAGRPPRRQGVARRRHGHRPPQLAFRQRRRKSAGPTGLACRRRNNFLETEAAKMPFPAAALPLGCARHAFRAARAGPNEPRSRVPRHRAAMPSPPIGDRLERLASSSRIELSHRLASRSSKDSDRASVNLNETPSTSRHHATVRGDRAARARGFACSHDCNEVAKLSEKCRHPSCCHVPQQHRLGLDCGQQRREKERVGLAGEPRGLPSLKMGT
jgi:hypothetical protein